MKLKDRISKMKNFLFDDVDPDEQEEKKVKKEHRIKKEEKEEPIQEVKEETTNFEDFFEDVSDNSVEEFEIPSKSRSEKKDFSIPEFDDDDFMVEVKKPEPIYEEPVRKEEKTVLYQGSRKRKEETKRFKPSPIISPIYGLLDEQGNTISDDKEVSTIINQRDEVTFDDVRKKAYGSLDDEIEDTLKRLSSKTIEEAEAEMNKEEKLSRTSKMPVKEIKRDEKKKEVFSPVEVSHEENEIEEDDDMILPSVNFKEIDVDAERTKKKTKKENEKKEISYDEDDDDEDDTKEQDLFNLIDTMYTKEGEE